MNVRRKRNQRIPPSPPTFLLAITYRKMIRSCYDVLRGSMKLRINITKRILTETGASKFCPAAYSQNGKIKSNVVLIDGAEVTRTDGAYYLDWTEGGKRIRKVVGPDAAKADRERLRQEAILNGKAQGMTPANGDGMRLDAAIEIFLEDYRISRSKKTWQQYKKALEYFKQSCSKPLVTDVTRRDLLQFVVFLREQGLAPRTVANKFEFTMTFLKAQK